MSFSRICIITILVCTTCTGAIASYIIEGKVIIDSSWDSVIYLSAINSLSHLNTSSEDFIINFARLDKDGRYVFQGNNLPGDDRLYRLHLVKKGDPVSTIIIGGKDENHIHFIMNGDSHITCIPEDFERLFSFQTFKGHPANELVAELAKMIDENRQLQGYPSETTREYHLSQFQDRLRMFADTCSHPLVLLLALQEMDLAQDYTAHRKFYQAISKKLSKAEPSPYMEEFLAQIDFLEFQRSPSSGKWLLPLLGALLLSSGLLYLHFRNKRKKSENKSAEYLKTPLSYREQRIFNLLINGKSNKEISNMLHIEVTTVKSHIRNIYSKLGIRSRKEALTITTHDPRLTLNDRRETGQ